MHHPHPVQVAHRRRDLNLCQEQRPDVDFDARLTRLQWGGRRRRMVLDRLMSDIKVGGNGTMALV